MSEKSVAEQVQDLRESWNPAPVDNTLERVVGVRPDEGDTRATGHVRDAALDHPQNPGRDDLDGGRMYQDDGDDEDDVSYDDMTKDELKAEIDSRNEGRDEDDHLSKAGNKQDLIDRLVEDDESEDDSEE